MIQYNNCLYDGDVDENNLPNGKGSADFKDGSKYDGEWVNGEINGNGIMSFKNGDKYEGNF